LGGLAASAAWLASSRWPGSMSRREAPEHILAADLMTLFGRIATGMSFPFLSDRFAPAISTVEGVYQNRPLFPSETVRSLRDGANVGIPTPRIGSIRRPHCGADDRRSGICATDAATIRNPSLLFPAIRKNARCSLSRENSLQTVESIGKFDSHCTGFRCNF
jgi:hypothetical protein